MCTCVRVCVLDGLVGGLARECVCVWVGGWMCACVCMCVGLVGGWTCVCVG